MKDEIYEVFQSLFPYMLEVADEVTTKETQAALSTIVISEIGDNDTAIQYIESFRIENLSQEKRIVRFVAASEKIKSLEIGIKSFSIKDRMLSAGKPGVKVSKQGFLYRTIPISQEEEKTGKKVSEKQQKTQAQIRDILASANFSLKMAFKNKESNEYTVVDKAPGLARTRVFESKEAFVAGKKAKKSNTVVFRTMSNKPGTSEWKHPGIPGKNIKNQIDRWLVTNEDAIFNDVLDNLMEQFFGE